MNNKIIKITVLIIICALTIFYSKNICIYLEKTLTPLTHPTYNDDKALVSAYFDEAFYVKQNAAKLQETGLAPLDHFMIFGSKGEWSDHCDPNDWFNVTLYKERLWPCKGNAFVDFLKQPPQKPEAEAETIVIYAKEYEIKRAWQSIEGFLRQNKYRVILILCNDDFSGVPACFKPQIARGLNIHFQKKPVPSFYQSTFLKNPEKYADVNYDSDTPPSDRPMRLVKQKADYIYVFHNMHRYTKWGKKGRINPLTLNFGRYGEEPLNMCPYGETEAEYKAFMRRIASGFDLLFTGVEINTKNSRVIPGYMESWIAENEIPKKKTYSVSFMLSLSGKGMTNFSAKKNRNYYMRKSIWDREKEFALPTQFYISIRSIDQFPKELRNRALPTDSRKWICGSQFTVAIENTQQQNYFTEKLLYPS